MLGSSNLLKSGVDQTNLVKSQYREITQRYVQIQFCVEAPFGVTTHSLFFYSLTILWN